MFFFSGRHPIRVVILDSVTPEVTASARRKTNWCINWVLMRVIDAVKETSHCWYTKLIHQLVILDSRSRLLIAVVVVVVVVIRLNGVTAPSFTTWGTAWTRPTAPPGACRTTSPSSSPRTPTFSTNSSHRGDPSHRDHLFVDCGPNRP